MTQSESEERFFTEDRGDQSQPGIPDEKTEAGVRDERASVEGRREADTARVSEVQAASLTVSI